MRYLVWSVPITVVAAAFTYWLSTSASSDVGSASKAESSDIQEGALLYADNCASCHGANLEGQPEWRTPGADGRPELDSTSVRSGASELSRLSSTGSSIATEPGA